MKTLPDAAQAYKRTPEFTETTVPAGLERRHDTKAGVWGRIRVLEGRLRYRILEPDVEEHVLEPGLDGIVEPQVPHHLEMLGPVRFFVEFLREKDGS
ncbi:MAG: DUF1971 domain-containing protein [Myxococcota bacterium]